jgi:hypothetical protein
MAPDDIAGSPADAADAGSASPPAETSSGAPSPSESADHSAADTGQSKETLLDAVLKVVPATTETDVLAATKDKAPPEATQPDSEDQAETETDDTSSEEDEQAPQEATPAIRKKINKLLKQRRELRDEVSHLRKPAEIGSELETFAKTNDLSGDDVANTLRMAAMLRAGDYQSFYQAVAPFVRTAQEYLGIVLPRDLQDEVRKGQMTEAAAKAFARQRFDGQRAQFERQAVEEAHGRQQVQYVQNDVQRAVSNFELRLSASDPDYRAKQPAVRRVAQALLFERGGTISSVEEALALTQEAYNEVNKQVRSYQPRPTATALNPNGATQSPSARAAPKTLMEAAIQGLENARRAGG